MGRIFRKKISDVRPQDQVALPESEPGQNVLAESGAVGGPNAVFSALKNRPHSCRSLMVADGRRGRGPIAEILSLARAASVPVKIVPRTALDRVYGGEGHQGVVAVFDPLAYATEDFLAELPADGSVLVLALDKVEDPGNLGALIRSAAAFGARAVVAPRDHMAPLTPGALRAAAGAAEIVPLVRVTNLRRALEKLQKQGFWIVGADGDGSQTLAEFDFPQRTVLVLGSEGRGLSDIIKKNCDFILAVDQKRGAVSSLNVSVAGGIIMNAYFCRHLSGGDL